MVPGPMTYSLANHLLVKIEFRVITHLKLIGFGHGLIRFGYGLKSDLI